MRIIAGQRRGHKIDGPRASAGTRPTSDLVRESLFNILGDLVVDRLFFDLFAGTGAVGLEALSRGALRVIFVERDRENVALIHRNVAALRYEEKALVRHADAYRWGRSLEPAENRPIVVFLDPPYRDYERNAGRVNQLIGQLVERLPAGSALALEAGRHSLDGRALADHDAWDVRRYGNTRIAIRVVKGGVGRAHVSSDPGYEPDLPAPPADVPEDRHGD
jgi:16S rRNA (guanine966-N2)-methyltransferase